MLTQSRAQLAPTKRNSQIEMRNMLTQSRAQLAPTKRNSQIEMRNMLTQSRAQLAPTKNGAYRFRISLNHAFSTSQTILNLQICVQFCLSRGRRRDTLFRDFHLCRPCNRVENELTEFVIRPIPMEMPTSKPESTSAIRTFYTPS